MPLQLRGTSDAEALNDWPCIAAGLPVFTGPIYGWKGSQNGVLLGVLGIASIPVSFIVGYTSPHVSDRSLTLAAVIVTALGAALCTQAGLRRLAVAYFGGGGMLYLVRPLHPAAGVTCCSVKNSRCIPQDVSVDMLESSLCTPFHQYETGFRERAITAGSVGMATKCSLGR